MEINWKFFCGACLVVGAALFKAGVPPIPIAAGMGLAGFAKFLRFRAKSARTGSAVAKAR